MATSIPNRFTPLSQSSIVDGRVVGTNFGTSNQTTSQTQNTSQQQNTSSNQTQTVDQTTKNFTSAQEAALNALIAQLSRGGTPEIQQQRAQRDALVASTQNQQSQFTKENAFADSQGLVAQQMRRALESMLPSINRAAEDAGSSGGALRALLLQDAANKAAESSAALGVQTATQYGNLSTNFAQVLEALTRSDPKATELLVQALGVSKGGTQTVRGTTNTVGSQTTNTTGSAVTNGTTTGATTENKAVTTDYAPFQVSTTPTFYGALDQPGSTSFAGTSLHNREQLAGLLDNNAWAGFEF
jgi:hypothetical protein